MSTTKIIGHRGAAGLQPENTIASIEAALALGVDMIEIDVHVVEDTLVVFHDFRLERLTGQSGRLADCSLDELARFQVSGHPIPTLANVLTCVQGKSALNIEIKGKNCVDLLTTTLQTLLHSGWKTEDLIVSSFDHIQLAELKTRLPTMRYGILIECQPIDLAKYASDFGAYSLHVNHENLSQDFLQDAHKRGLAVIVYTVNHPEEMRQLISMGVDGIITDYPDRLRTILKKPSGKQ